MKLKTFTAITAMLGLTLAGTAAIGMDYSKLTPLLVEAVNALRAEKDEEIDALHNRIDSLKRMVEQLVAAQMEKTK